MSARSYQLKLKETLEKLLVATRTAKEWKTVAENRLAMLYDIDEQINTQVDCLAKVGTIFGVDPVSLKLPLGRSGGLSGDETASVTLERVFAVSAFTANLTREAVSLQETLNETLRIAIDASSVDPPLHDLRASKHTSEPPDCSSPLKEIYDEVENLMPAESDSTLLVTREGREQTEDSEILTLPGPESNSNPERAISLRSKEFSLRTSDLFAM